MKKHLKKLLSFLFLAIVIMIGINASTAVSAACNHSFIDANDTECNICQQTFAIIKFNSNGGSSIEQIRTPVNESVTIPSETPTRSNYIFAGWSTNKNGDVMYKAGASFKAVNSITLYAQWNKKCSVTESATCSACSGSGEKPGTVTCYNCSGSGVETIYKGCTNGCNSDGYIMQQCTYCKGTKEVRLCKTCSSGGNKAIAQLSCVANHDTYYGLCYKCDSNGKMRADCPKCEGGRVASTRKCSVCSGKGKYNDYITCSTCSGKGTKQITCTKCNGSGVVSRKSVSAPGKPVLKSITLNTIELQSISNGEYSLDGKVWQDSPVFNVTEEKEYTFYQRYAKTDTTYASPASAALKVLYHNHVYDNSCDTTCNTCNEIRSVTHIYDGSCDIQCNVCLKTRTTSVAHSYDNACDAECNICYYKRSSSVVHTYDNACDTDCNICGNTRVIQHKYSLDFDTTKHFNKCTECGDITDSETHKFDNACDKNCRCGYVRTVTHNYQMNQGTSATHWKECSICSDRININPHVYDNACDSTCSDCGYVRVTYHNYQTVYNSSNHWMECTVCSDKINIKSHVYDNTCDSICNDCGYVRVAYHNYQTVYNNSNHWMDCTVCHNKTNIESHIYDNACDTDCSYCDYTRITTHNHQISYDSKHHFDKCINCGDVINVRAHEFDNACDTMCNYCGAMRTITHNYNSGEVSKAETCKDTGIMIFTCSTCGDTKTETIPKSTTHTYTNNCDSSCNVCGATRTGVQHRYTNDCDAVCDYCGEERIPSNHIYDDKNDNYCNVCNYYLLLKYQIDYWDRTVTITDLDNSYSGNLEIPETINGYSVTSIGSSAFNGCTGLTSITIPDGVKSIGIFALEGCTNLTSIKIPDSVVEIGSCAFSNCDALKKVYVSDVNSWLTIPFDSFDSNPLYCGAELYIDNKLVTELVIPYGITSIGSYAFSGCTSLKSITIPDSVTCIGEYAFGNCTNLASITIPNSVTSIEENAFYNCDGLTKVYISDMSSWCNIKFSNADSNPASCGYWGGYSRKLYLNGSLVTDVIIPDGVTAIGDYAFYGYSELESVKISNSVKSIGYGAFYRCTKLESIVIPNSVTSIGAHTFYGCKNLIKVTLPDNLTHIEGGLFAECSNLISFNFPSKLKSIGSWAFAECDSLVTVKIPKGVTEIGQNAFERCQNLRTVVLPEGITEISLYTFRSCFNLESITIPKSLKKIGQEAFLNTHAQKVYISDLAAWCNIEFERDDSSESPLSNYADIYLNNKCLVNVVIPKQVTSIRDHAFYGCQNIKSVTLHDNITSIGDSAFEYCSKLETINLPDSIKSIGDRAFSYCHNIKKIAIPKNTTVIGGDAFSESGVKVLYIPKGTAFIKANAFDYMKYDQNGFPNNTHVTYVYYGGSKSDKKNLTILPGNDALGTAKWIYNAKGLPKCVYDNACDTGCNMCGTTRIVTHSYKTTTTKATLSKNGKVVNKCSVCGVSKTTTIYYPKTFKLSTTAYTYNGKTKIPSVTVKDYKGNTLKKDTDYTVSYESGRKYPGEYTVKITFKGKYEGTKRLYFTIAPKATSKITATQTTTTITLKWNKVTGADGYRVYKYNSKTKKYEKLKDVTGTSLKISKLKEGTAYKYKVRAYTKDDGTIWGAYSSAIETATKCKTPSITKLTTTKGNASFTWSNVAGESGYQVYYSTKKDSGYKKVASYKTNIVKGSKSKLTSGKTYYFKVRAYKKTASGTVYSAWSPIKSLKVK